MIDMFRRVRARVPNVALGVIIGLLVGGGAYAVAQTSQAGDEGVHGGPKPRFHDAKVCDLVDVSKLPGNWTHGDYVSAVEKDDPSKVREAAQSPCGKPNHAGQGAAKDKQKGSDKEKKPAEESSKPKADPSPKPTAPASKPSPSPSATGSASPVVPLESPLPTPSAAASPSTEN
jgi:hypothetical protein